MYSTFIRFHIMSIYITERESGVILYWADPIKKISLRITRKVS